MLPSSDRPFASTALLGAAFTCLLVAAGADGRTLVPRPAAELPTRDAAMSYRFDVPEGPLETAIAAIEATAGVRVTLPDGVALPSLTADRLSGVFTLEQALAHVLAGTGMTARQTGPAAYTLEFRVTESVDVTASHRIEPYRAGVSATATKTLTPLRDIPQTLNIVPRALLVDQRARSIADAVKSVPGVSVAQGEGNRDQLVLRGISTASDFFVNGIRDDQERFRDLYNVESVEVLQGPAAVLFGRGGAGGIVNLVTAKPVPGSPSDVSVEFGRFDRKRATAQLGAALGGRAAFRLSVMGEDSGGFRDAFFLRRYGMNPTVSLDLGRETTMTVGFEHLSDRRLADRGIPSQAGRPVPAPLQQFFGSPDQNRAQSGVDAVSASIEHRVTPRLTLRNGFLVGRYDKFYENVYAGSAVNAAGVFSLSAYNHSTDRTNTFNQTDLVYHTTIAGLTHTLLVGFEAGHQFQDEWRHTARAIPNVTLATSERRADFVSAPLAVDRHASSDVLAGYAQDQIALTSRWKAVLGARTDRFSVAVVDHLPGNPNLSRTDVAASPRAGVIYQPSSSTSLYGSYSYTFLPSGQTLALATNTAELEPENAKNYEVGAKLDFFGDRLTVSAALFRLDRNHVKSTDPNDPNRLVLTGQQRTDGFTLSAAGTVARRWKVYGGYANLDAEVTASTTSAPAGRMVGLVPRSQLTLWSTCDLAARWGVGGGLVDQSKMFTSFSNQVELPRFTRVDAVVYYKLRGYRLAMNIENLLDATYYPTANGDNNISPGAPFSATLSLRATF